MRSTLALVLATLLALTVDVPLALASTTVVASQDQAAAKELYEDGRKAFRLGRYQEAVTKFEEAYAASDNALLLYNIGLAYWRWYGVSKDVEHLRKAKIVLQNFVLEAQRDPDRLGDPAEAVVQIKEIDLELEQAERLREREEEEQREAAERQRQADQAAAKPAQDADSSAPKPAAPAGADPGKKFRVGGGVAAGIGGAGLVAGAVAGAVLAVKGSDYEKELQGYYDQRTELGCDPDVAMETADCDLVRRSIETTRDNGKLANTFAIVSFVGMGVGAGVLATGIALLVIGRKRTNAWRKGQAFQWNVWPTGRGVALGGRF